LFRNRLFAAMIRSVNAVPIDQEGVGKEGIRAVLEALEKGQAVLVFPEGSRTPDGVLHELRPGIQLLIKRARAPIVPVGVAGAYDAWPIWRGYPIPAPLFLPARPGTIGVVVGKPLDSQEFAALPRAETLARLSEEIAKAQMHAERLRRR